MKPIIEITPYAITTERLKALRHQRRIITGMIQGRKRQFRRINTNDPWETYLQPNGHWDTTQYEYRLEP